MTILLYFLFVVNNSHSYSKWSVVWSFLQLGHEGEFIILKRCRYDFVLTRPLSMVVRCWFVEIFMFSLSATIGKYSLVVLPLVEQLHTLCHFSTLVFSSSISTRLLGILL